METAARVRCSGSGQSLDWLVRTSQIRPGLATGRSIGQCAPASGRSKDRPLPSVKTQERRTVKKWVYFFGAGKAEGDGEWRDLLGGKGAGLAEMTKIGLPVPAGFTISTEACDYYYKHDKKYPSELDKQVKENVARLEKATGKKLGDPKSPLLVSVRSGSARSMPGMMETILNLGLNDNSVQGLAGATKNERFAYDAYRRFVQMYSTVVMGLSKEDLEHRLRAMKQRQGVKLDTDVPASGWKELVAEYKAYFKEKAGKPFPEAPMEQLWGAIGAVFGSWMAEKAVTYRRVEKITGLLGTAVNVVQMVFGNTGDNSGTGVCFTRDPSTGEEVFYGDYLTNAQGEDVVAGIRTPVHLNEFAKLMPKAYAQLEKARGTLEKHYKDMQDMEFTVEEGTLYMLQTRTGKRTPAAAFKMAVDMANEKLITKEDAILRIKPEDIERLFYPVIDSKLDKKTLQSKILTHGIDAVPGAAVGKVCFSAHEAEDWVKRGEKVILVRRETSPEDVGGMAVAQGILTATGGKTSHAAVVARGWGKCCIVGAETLGIDYGSKSMKDGKTGKTVKEGEWLTLDGSEGTVYAEQLPLVTPELPKAYQTIMKWADEIRTLGVRTNADTPQDARKAVEFGAEGIGLVRTEHMFFTDFEFPEKGQERQRAIQEMILAETKEARVKALDRLLPFQRRDFIGIFKAMDGLPVTIRLIDPPLHEFVPHERAKQEELAKELGINVETVARRVQQLHEANPMLGHRGCRLCITYPEILDMQVRAIIEAAIECQKNKIKVIPEIMMPLVLDKKEMSILEQQTRAVADDIIKKAGIKLHYMVGTMVELPRAALLADEIAEVAEFFSFGTNDLTQTVMGLSRDDAGRFLPDYVDEKKSGIFRGDPFQTLDVHGVGMLVRWGIEKGRKTRPHLEIGICGEHGGDADSVKFCHQVGMDYVSASPFRVPIARLAAAQAKVEEDKAKSKGKAKAAKR
ncbi:MAG TPA: pyruvate, phosphate dikinase [Candidatus Eremiobacteraceae bacterium]|nr:pyruvate, phosphate dikinase [Candidatus Eremiobacteraceae bacterium]